MESEQPKCRCCGAVLKEGSNWRARHAKQKYKICKSCYNKYVRERRQKNIGYHREVEKKWREKNREKHNRQSREWYRKNKVVSSGDRVIKGKKRAYPIDNRCELCGKFKKLLAYHHWDDSELLRGVWVCYRCHVMIGQAELGLVEKWGELKMRIEQEVPMVIIKGVKQKK